VSQHTRQPFVELALRGLFVAILLGVAILLLSEYACNAQAERTEWRLTAVPAGHTVDIVVPVPMCDPDPFDRIEVEETDGSVTIEAYARNGEGADCDDAIQHVPMKVELGSPLGGRVLRGCVPSSARFPWNDGVTNDDCRVKLYATPETQTTATQAAPAADAVPHERYMQLSEARALLRDLGLEGTTLSPGNYECIQTSCPDEARGDDSWGCLWILPTGDPARSETLLPDDPPRWYSVLWRSGLAETYSAPPEPVVREPEAVLEPDVDLACGVPSERHMTAGEAQRLVEEADLVRSWGTDPMRTAVCPTASCSMPGIRDDDTGCLRVAIYQIPQGPHPGGLGPGVDIYVSWQSDDFGVSRSSSAWRRLGDVERYVEAGSDAECLQMRGEHNPYYGIPYTEAVKPADWRLTAEPQGRRLDLIVTFGGCQEFERLDVEETGDLVQIDALILQSNLGPNAVCTLQVKAEEVSIELQSNLGDRRLEGCDPLPRIRYFEEARDCREVHD
jgi:hypothetical protein